MIQLNHTHKQILKYLSRNVNASIGSIAANIKAVSYGSLKNHISLLEDNDLVYKYHDSYVKVSITPKGESYLRAS